MRADRAALARRVAALEDHRDAQALVAYGRLQVDQLGLHPLQLRVVDLPRPAFPSPASPVRRRPATLWPGPGLAPPGAKSSPCDPTVPPRARSCASSAVLARVLALLWLLWVSRGVITWVAIGAFLAVAINPLVTLLQARLRLRRAAAILLVYLLLTAVVAGAALLFVPPADRRRASSSPRRCRSTSTGSPSRAWCRSSTRSTTCSTRLEAEATSALEGIAGPDTAFELATRVINGLVALISIARHLLPAQPLRAAAARLGARAGGGRAARAARAGLRPHLPGHLRLRASASSWSRLTGGFAVWVFLTHPRRALRAAAGVLGRARLARAAGRRDDRRHPLHRGRVLPGLADRGRGDRRS